MGSIQGACEVSLLVAKEITSIGPRFAIFSIVSFGSLIIDHQQAGYEDLTLSTSELQYQPGASDATFGLC